MSAFGFTMSGEWSLGVNDCGQFLNGVNNGTRFEGTYKDGSPTEDVVYGNCDDFTDISTFNDTFKTQMMEFALTNMDSFQVGSSYINSGEVDADLALLQNWFFWTWNIGESQVLKRVAVRVAHSRFDQYLTY
jgi:glucan 1,3-beta-glucosidase